MSSVKTTPFTRYELLQRIREEQGNSEQTVIRIDYSEEVWETVDLLLKQFGRQRTDEIINASSPFPTILDDL